MTTVLGVHVLVVAKAPVAGEAKTRLGAAVGMSAAAELAAAALLDTLASGRAAVPDRAHRHVALAGGLHRAARRDDLARALEDWVVHPQSGIGLAERLFHAHRALPGPVVQVGMDTPQLTPGHLAGAAERLTVADAVLGPADDGGWWLLGLRDPAAAAVLVSVPMSTPTTYDDTRAALLGLGLTVAAIERLRDVDRKADAELVAAEAPTTRFAHAWRDVR